MWPCGSSGWPHSGQGSRPEATTRGRAFDERARDGGRHPDPEEVRAVLVLVVISSGSIGLAVLVHGAGLDEDQLRAAVPASVSDPARKASMSGSSSGAASAHGGRPGHDRRLAAPLELGEELAEPLGQDRDLGLLERDRHDPAAVAGLEEERPVARLADRAGHESVGRVEEIASSRHVRTLYRIWRGGRGRTLAPGQCDRDG